tara:strand:- start:117 stop:437 length:321 start_codon:yes stop_codon:yes gene_type:complete
MTSVMDHYLETGEVLGKGSDNLEGYQLPEKGYFPPGKVPSFNRDFFDMPTGKESENALDELKKTLDKGDSLSENEKEKAWKTFQNRIVIQNEQGAKVIDMGMDIDL